MRKRDCWIKKCAMNIDGEHLGIALGLPLMKRYLQLDSLAHYISLVRVYQSLSLCPTFFRL